MRISTAALHLQGIQDILRQQSALARTQNELALGTRLLTAADDPAAFAHAQSLDRQLAQVAQFQSNVGFARGRLEREESALASGTEALNRIRELTLEANSGTQSADSRHALALEMRSRLDELLSVANSGDGAGRYLFGGTADAKAPFTLDASGATYGGDQNVPTLQVGTERQVAIGDAGDLVFQKPQDVFGALQKLVATVDSYPTDDAGRAADQAAIAEGLKALDGALGRFSDVRSTVGNRLSALDDADGELQALDVQGRSELSDVRDVDLAEATGRLNLQMTALQAAQQSYVRIQGLSLFDYLR